MLLARHGNTFAPGQKVVWVGARNDLPLVDSGLAQAEFLAQAMEKAAIKPEAIYAATLKRTISYAQIVHSRLQLPGAVSLDKRLDEIDYGEWSGLSNDEIKAQFGDAELNDWNELGKWPRIFNCLESDIEEQVKSFGQELVKDRLDNKITLAVTSNGRLKYFLKLMPNVYRRYVKESAWKVATGNICLLGYEECDWRLILWNENPRLLASSGIVHRV